MTKAKPFATEADMVAAFCAWVEQLNAAHRRQKLRSDGNGEPSTWTIYAETAGYDLLLVEDQTGVQLGIEAKLSLNLKVIDQILPRRYDRSGTDYRAVLVPYSEVQNNLDGLCHQIGINILRIYDTYAGDRGGPNWYVSENLPDERSTSAYGCTGNWHPWFPIEREQLPDYVPDVSGGKPSPVALTDWKIRAIKLLIVLEKRGHVTRADMKALKISPTRWTAASYGYLAADRDIKAYVACSNTPDLKAQHPTNYAQIEADFDTWAKAASIKVD